MNRRVLLLTALTFALAILSGCGNGIGKLPGSSEGALSVQMVQPPPSSLNAGQSAGLVATVLNDSKNGGVTWTCAPAGACGSFNPTTTAYQITTLYTAPEQSTSNTVTITATSVTDSSQSASAT